MSPIKPERGTQSGTKGRGILKAAQHYVDSHLTNSFNIVGSRTRGGRRKPSLSRRLGFSVSVKRVNYLIDIMHTTTDIHSHMIPG